MISATFTGKLKSKGRPPKWFDVPNWIRRMFVWDETKDVMQTFHFDEGNLSESKSWMAFGVPVRLTVAEREFSVAVFVQIAGVLVFERSVQKFSETFQVKASYQGQGIEGDLTFVWE